MSDTFIVKPNGKSRNIANLGWLLRHKADVENVLFYDDGRLVAFLKDGTTYHTRFASNAIRQRYISKRFWIVGSASYNAEWLQNKRFGAELGAFGEKCWNATRDQLRDSGYLVPDNYGEKEASYPIRFGKWPTGRYEIVRYYESFGEYRPFMPNDFFARKRIAAPKELK